MRASYVLAPKALLNHSLGASSQDRNSHTDKALKARFNRPLLANSCFEVNRAFSARDFSSTLYPGAMPQAAVE